MQWMDGYALIRNRPAGGLGEGMARGPLAGCSTVRAAVNVDRIESVTRGSLTVLEV